MKKSKYILNLENCENVTSLYCMVYFVSGISDGMWKSFQFIIILMVLARLDCWMGTGDGWLGTGDRWHVSIYRAVHHVSGFHCNGGLLCYKTDILKMDHCGCWRGVTLLAC